MLLFEVTLAEPNLSPFLHKETEEFHPHKETESNDNNKIIKTNVLEMFFYELSILRSIHYTSRTVDLGEKQSHTQPL